MINIYIGRRYKMLVMVEGTLVDMEYPDHEEFGLIEEGYNNEDAEDLIDLLHLKMFEGKRVRITIEEVE